MKIGKYRAVTELRAARQFRSVRTCVAVIGALFICLFADSLWAAKHDLQLKSPTGIVAITFSLDAKGVPDYAVRSGASPVILKSRLGLGPDWASEFTLASSTRTRHVEHWKPLYGERSLIPDIYNQLTLKLVQAGGRAIIVEFRAYDEGVAIRYGAPAAIEADNELTEFRLPANTFAYEEHGGTEGEYFRSSVAQIKPQCQAPLTLALADGTYAAILEAANIDFPLMTLGAKEGSADTLAVGLGGHGILAAGDFTPWRLLMFSKTPGQLLEHNYVQLDLNGKNAIDDTSWIKPGTALREVTLSTDGAHHAIDFAAAHGIKYVGFDDGWYGSEDSLRGDARQERTHDAKGNPVPPLDIREAVAYGKQRGVGIIPYVDRRQAMRQREVLFPLYEKWGVAGVKIGFVEVGGQENTKWIMQTVRDAASHHLMLDIHDQYRSTGYTRTYPNLLTVEGIRGNEHFPTAEHDTTLPFTRYLAGPADYTICYYDKRLKNTHAHQMAMAVVSYSPLQWLFWYDKPEYSHGEPELQWFDRLPTVWDETRVPLGEVGKYAVLARRSGDRWYVGAIGNSDEQDITLPLKFLTPGLKYDATIYTDDSAVQTNTHVAVAHRIVVSSESIALALIPLGGEAIYLAPVAGSEKK